MIRKFQFKKNGVVLILFSTALFFYFFSEYILRDNVLKAMNAEKINLDTLLLRLPDSIREKVKNKILKAQLRDDYKAASTSADIIYTTIALARFEQSEEVLQQVYIKLLKKYPTAPQLSTAYLYFYKESGRDKVVTNDDLHEYINSLPSIDRYYMWKRGFDKLKAKKVPALEIINFLTPILNIKPKYKNYSKLYLELAEAAFAEKNDAIESKARNLEEGCGSLPVIELER